MGQRTCGSYSLPCFAFPALVDGVDGDVVGGGGLQAPHEGGGARPGDLEYRFLASADGEVLEPVVEQLARRRRPGDPHGPLRLVFHRQLFAGGGG